MDVTPSDWLALPENSSEKPCEDCDGTGRAGEDACPSCGGFGY